MERFCSTLDLKDDPLLIAAYEDHHKQVSHEILKSIKAAGVESMEIYRVETRMFMIMETVDGFSFEKKALMDAGNPLVQDWENLMWQYQETLPFAKSGEKWVLMNKIFSS